MNKKIAVLFLVITFIVISLSACSKGTKEKNMTDKAVPATTDQKDSAVLAGTMGRYMERTFDLPKLEGNESIIKILQNAENQFEIYTVNIMETTFEYLCYRRTEDSTWEKSKPEWLNTSDFLKPYMVLIDLCQGEDGKYYAIYNNYENTSKSSIIKSEAADTAQVVNIPYLENPAHKFDGKEYYPSIESISVLQNGNIVLKDTFNDSTMLIFDQQGNSADEIAINRSQNYIVVDNYIIFENEEEKIVYYNTDTRKIDRAIEYSRKGENKVYAIKQDGTLIMGDSNGIHRLSPNGTLWETTVDGALNTMSMPSLRLKALFVNEGEMEEYYTVSVDEKRGYQLKQYVFDKNISTLPEKEITVYSLQENNTIRQAISLFQAKNPNVKINYVVAMGEQGGMVSDYINALNAELLSGNGADILVLDGLPYDAYTEKGVLADFADIINPLETSGKLLTNISENFHEDGKIFHMPIRYSVPIIVGKEDAVRASENLAGIIDYIQKNKQIPYAEQSTFTNLLKDYLALNFEVIFQNGKLQVDQLTNFLEGIKVIGENIGASENLNSSNVFSYSDGFNRNNDKYIFNGNYYGVGDQYATAMGQISNVMDTIIPNAYAEKYNLTYKSIGDSFISKGLIGLNSTSKDIDLAKEFISFLYSEELQDTNLYDGFPMLQSSLEKWFKEEMKDLYISVSDGKGGRIDATWPKKEVRDAYLKLTLKVKKPIEYNPQLNDMIIEHALLYLTGQEGINQAAAAINTKVNTYLAE